MNAHRSSVLDSQAVVANALMDKQRRNLEQAPGLAAAWFACICAFVGFALLQLHFHMCMPHKGCGPTIPAFPYLIKLLSSRPGLDSLFLPEGQLHWAQVADCQSPVG